MYTCLRRVMRRGPSSKFYFAGRTKTTTRLFRTHNLSTSDCVPGWPRHVRAYGGWLGSEEPMKDVAACDKLRGGGKQPMIRRSPNGETYTDEVGMPRTEYIGTWRAPGEVKHLSTQRKRE